MSGLAATLGLQLDARGFVTAANQATGALFGLGDSAKRVESQTKSLATNAAISLGQMATSGARDIGSLLRSASGLAFALNPLAGAISLAVVGIGTAWADARREAKKNQDDMLADAIAFATKLKQTQEAGLLGMAGVTLGALKQEAQRAMTELASIGRQMNQAQPVFTGAGGGMMLAPDTTRLERQRQAVVEHLVKLQGLIVATEKETTRITVEEAAKRAKADEDAWLRRMKAADNGLKITAGTLREGLESLFGDGPVKAPDIMADIAASAKVLGREFQDVILPGIQAFLNGLKDAERQAKALEQMKLGAGVGLAGAIFGQMGGFGSAISGALSGGLSGSAGGPAGIAIGATLGLADGLMSLAGASNAAEDRAEALRLQFEQFTDSIKEQLGILSGLDARTREVQRQFAAMRDAMGEAQVALADVTPNWLQPAWIAEARGRIDDLNSLERQYLELLKQQEQQRINDIQQESAVLRLRIQGSDEMADAMQRSIDKQRELREAHEAGASAAELQAIKERQRLEDIFAAMQQAQERIAGLTATIGGLQSFRNALLLSPDAGLSPTQQLAEARRQYEEILLKALGGDQGAAGNLSGAAQTLLGFSRSVNASGSAFQNDLATILADNAEVIQRFQDLKSVEEQMLEQLKKIAEDTGELSGRAASDPTRPHDPRDHSLGRVMQEGLLELRNEVRILTQRVEEQTQVNRNGFDGVTTVVLN